MKPIRVAVVGATGAVGKELFSILKERNFPLQSVRAFASPRSVGKPFQFGDQTLKVEGLRPGCFSDVDLAFFDASDEVSREWVPQAAESGAWVVDNSAAFRLEQDVPLLVPEVNGSLLRNRLKADKHPSNVSDRILSGPNCSTVQLVVALKPLRDAWGIDRVVVASYQSVSGAGQAARQELLEHTHMRLHGSFPDSSRSFAYPMAFNCIPQIGGFKEDGSTSEETKIILESRKILGLPELRVAATCVRVPTLSSHGEVVYVELKKKPASLEAVREAFRVAAGLTLADDPSKNLYPLCDGRKDQGLPIGSGADTVYLGRLREDASVDAGLSFWITADNLRKGAALNAVQIAELLIDEDAF